MEIEKEIQRKKLKKSVSEGFIILAKVAIGHMELQELRSIGFGNKNSGKKTFVCSFDCSFP